MRESIQKLVEDITSKLPRALLPLTGQIRSILEESLKNSLAKLDVVTKEEHEIALELLKKTRAKVEALEAQMRKEML